MKQSSKLQSLVSTECPTPRRKVGHGKPARSGPPGKTPGLKRVSKTLTVSDLLNGHEEEATTTGNGKAEGMQ